MEEVDEPVRIVVVRRLHARSKSDAFGDTPGALRRESGLASLRAFIRTLLSSLKAIARRSRNGGG
jgi:hypothetical protein